MPHTVDPDPTTGPAPSQVRARDRRLLPNGNRRGQNPAWDLMRLLHDFKAARQRRDDAAYDTRAWHDADDDIQELQHSIFDLSFEDGAGTDHVARATSGPDDELGQPDDRAAV